LIAVYIVTRSTADDSDTPRLSAGLARLRGYAGDRPARLPEIGSAEMRETPPDRLLAGEAEMKWIVSHHEFGEMAAVAIEMLDLSSWWRRR
jgi:hypothetical protein